MKKIKRNSSIELLKIFAIFLIVISHVTQSVSVIGNVQPVKEYLIPLGYMTDNVQNIFLNLFFQAGTLGNTIFFVCSCWFFVEKESKIEKKAFNLLLTIWHISMLFCLVYVVFYTPILPLKEIIKQFLPTTFQNNWYMTNYIMFLIAYPFLNKLIKNITKNEHFRIIIFTSVVWLFASYIKSGLFFSSQFLIWVTIYFIIAYLKKYCMVVMNSNKVGNILVFIGMIGYFLQILLTNYLGHYVSFFSDKLLHWNNNGNPFYLITAIGLLIILQKKEFKSQMINYISSLSIYVYLIHENYLFRTYTRPIIWSWLHKEFGYSKIVILVVLFAIVLFLISLSFALIYKETIQKYVNYISDIIYFKLSKIYKKYEKKITLEIR